MEYLNINKSKIKNAEALELLAEAESINDADIRERIESKFIDYIEACRRAKELREVLIPDWSVTMIMYPYEQKKESILDAIKNLLSLNKDMELFRKKSKEFVEGIKSINQPEQSSE